MILERLKKSRLLFVLLATLTVVGAVAGCTPAADNGDDTGDDEPIKVGVMYAITNPAKAGGWDRADWVGIEYMREQGWEVNVAEGVPYPQTAATAAGYAEDGYPIVIFPDNGQIEAFKEVPPQYPDTWFIMTSLVDELPDADNVAAWMPDFYQYGAMLGIVMAKTTESGVVGVSGGMPIGALTEMYSGIIEGAKYADPDVEVLVSWVGDWVDIPKHHEVTQLQIDQGADVLFTVTGPGTTGVFEAAEAAGAKVIGYAADWYEDAPEVVMTSGIIDKGLMYKELVERYNDGTLVKEIVNCGPEYFKLADFHGSIPSELEAEVLEMVEDLRSGEIEIPKVDHPEIVGQ